MQEEWSEWKPVQGRRLVMMLIQSFSLVKILYSTDEDYFAVIEIYIEVLRFMTKLLLKAFVSII